MGNKPGQKKNTVELNKLEHGLALLNLVITTHT